VIFVVRLLKRFFPLLVGDLDFARRLRNPIWIQDHNDTAVSKNCVTGKYRDLAQQRGNGFNNDLLGVVDLIDDYPEGVCPDLADHDECFIKVGHVIRALDIQQLSQVDQREEAVSQAQDRCPVDHFDLVLCVGRGADEFDNTNLRNGKSFRAAFNDERRDDSEGQRDLDRKDRTLALGRFQLDRTADLVDVAFHNIHPDTAAGHGRNRCGRGKARGEHQLLNLVFGHGLRVGF